MITETEILASYERLKSLKDKNFKNTKILATDMQDISDVIQYVADQKKITAIAELKFNSKDKAIAEKVNSLYDNISKLELSDLEIKNSPEKNMKISNSTIEELINIAIYAYENREKNNRFYLHPLSKITGNTQWKSFKMVGPEPEYSQVIDQHVPDENISSTDKDKIYIGGVGTDNEIIIKGAIGNTITDGSYTGIQTKELPDSLDKYKFLYFVGSFETANEAYSNVYVKFGFKGDTQKTYNRIDTDFAHKLNDVTKVIPIKTEKGEECYQITFPDQSAINGYNTSHSTNISIKDFHYISFFVVNASNGNFAPPKIIIKELWLEPKEG